MPAWRFGACCCTVYKVHGTVKGCNNLVLAGATVTVTQGGSTIGTDTTTSLGAYGPITLTNGAGTYTVTVTATNFATATFTGSFPFTGVTDSQLDWSLSPASGYHCLHGCVLPIPDTLHWTAPDGTAMVLTYSGGSWLGCMSKSWSGGYHLDQTTGACTGPAATTAPVWYALSAATAQMKQTYGSCPAGIADNYTCSGDTGAAVGAFAHFDAFSVAASSLTCSPLSASFTWPGGAGFSVIPGTGTLTP